MDEIPKRVTVFLDSGHGDKRDNKVSYVLTESIDTEDDEAVVVRIIHAQQHLRCEIDVFHPSQKI